MYICYELNYLPILTMSVTKFTPESHLFIRIEYRLCWLSCVTQNHSTDTQFTHSVPSTRLNLELILLSPARKLLGF